MAKGRSSASWSVRAIVAIMAVSMLLLQADYVQVETYKVGDCGDWTFNVVGWPNGKQFKAGDDFRNETTRTAAVIVSALLGFPLAITYS